jgi:hypothetical protein
MFQICPKESRGLFMRAGIGWLVIRAVNHPAELGASKFNSPSGPSSGTFDQIEDHPVEVGSAP